MKAEWINPFLKATADTFSTMMGVQVQIGKPELLSADNNRKDVSGVIGLSGSLKGAVVVGFPEADALKISSLLVGEEYHELNADVSDAVGELANIIVGYAKKYFKESDLEISLPSVIRGKNHMVTMPQKVKVVRVPMKCEQGEFFLEIGLKSAE